MINTAASQQAASVQHFTLTAAPTISGDQNSIEVFGRISSGFLQYRQKRQKSKGLLSLKRKVDRPASVHDKHLIYFFVCF